MFPVIKTTFPLFAAEGSEIIAVDPKVTGVEVISTKALGSVWEPNSLSGLQPI